MKARFVTAAEKFHKARVSLNKIDDTLNAMINGVDMESHSSPDIIQRHKTLVGIANDTVANYQRMKIPPVKACEDLRDLSKQSLEMIDSEDLPKLRSPAALVEAKETEARLDAMREELIPMLYRSKTDLKLAETKLKNFERGVAPFVEELTPVGNMSPLEEKTASARARLVPLYNWQNAVSENLNPCINTAATLQTAKMPLKRAP